MEVKPGYLCPKGYKQTEVGAIPEEWEVKRFCEIGKLSKGKGLLKEDIKRSGSIPAIPYTALYTDYSEVLDYSLIKWFIDDESQSVIVREPCLLLASSSNMEANTGKASALVGNTPVAIGREIIVFKTSSDCKFISYLLSTASYRRKTLTLARGTTIKHVYPATFHGYQVALPPIPEQRAIAEALSDVDALLGGLDRLIAKKRDIKQAAMQQLLTGQTRLPGFHGEWEVKRLGSIADILKGSALSKSLTTTSGARRCILYGELFTTYGRVISDVFGRTNSSEGCPSMQGDVLMPGSTTTTGIDLATASALLMDDVALGGDIIIIRRKGDAYDSVFLSNYLTQARRQQIAELTQGITIHHLYGKDLKTLALELPPVPEQTAIAEVLTEMDAELAGLEQRREKTRALKQAMMQELLTGRTRLA